MSMKEWWSRRRVLGGAAGAAAGVAAGAAVAGAHAGESDGRLDVWLAKAEIAELRRLYARATDLIGLNTPEAIAEGRAIYHRVFTPDARIGATGQPSVTGPDAWVQIASDALKIYQDTQHLIGTQLVEIESMPDASGAGGRASASSYLQAWHAKADGELWLFMGTYHDKATYVPKVGWRIYEMQLEQVSGDRRKLGT